LDLLQKKARTTLYEQAQHFMDAISEAAQAMEWLVDDLLSFSRMDRHLPPFQKAALEALVRNILREFEPDKGAASFFAQPHE
jgi:light-regulated signal transduction histidine kinase (bacteriophytochrome)